MRLLRPGRPALLAAALVLPLALAGCGDDDGGPGDRDRADGDTAGDTAGDWDATGGTDAGSVPCGLVSAETRDALAEALDASSSGGADDLGGEAVGLLPGEETFAACGFAGGMLNVGVRAFDDGRPVAAIATPYGSDPAEPLAGLGDEAYVAVNSYDGLRVTVRAGDQVVLVDSQFRDDSDAVVSEDLLVDLAREVVDGLADVDVPAVELPASCPDPADELVTARVGEVRAARGAVGAAGIRCAYVGDEAFTTIGSQLTNEGYLAMGLAGSGDPVEVDGKEVYVDRDSAVLVASEECAVTATSSRLGWALADTRDEDEQRDDLVELAAAAYDVLGCA
ncbi:hypothetical protein [Nocardioides zeae]|uniref:DUF3558 domain-containing protein n=1 Tax=Nocardioides zeae TaxID=1457234 RepID=A0AAJ1X278_9ACTN|nr:hypothetical protein [Nocardioides zeae]MDQ1105621.1 hypothetical protein [Nocardioides zeae]